MAGAFTDMKKVLAFFGAFNPPTIAHIELGRYAMKQTGREGVLYVPSKAVYIKDDQGKSFAYADEARLEMLEAVAQHRPWMRAVDRELRMDSQPRTYDTLCFLREEGYEPALLMGSDKLTELEHGWKHVEEIVSEFGIVCMCRGRDDVLQMLHDDPYLHSLSAGITALQTPPQLQHISSSEVRSILRQIQSLREETAKENAMEKMQAMQEIESLIAGLRKMVPQEAADLIFQKHLTADTSAV